MFGQSEPKTEEPKETGEEIASAGAGSEISGRLVRPLRPSHEGAAAGKAEDTEEAMDLTAPVPTDLPAAEPREFRAAEPTDLPAPKAVEPKVPEAKSPAAPPPPQAEPEPCREGQVVVGAGVKIVGEIRDCRRIEIFGTVDGDLEVEEVLVHEDGLLKGHLKAETAEVHGAIDGEAIIKGLLDVKANGSVAGKTAYGSLSIETGGRVVGTLDDGKASKPPPLGSSSTATAPRSDFTLRTSAEA